MRHLQVHSGCGSKATGWFAMVEAPPDTSATDRAASMAAVRRALANRTAPLLPSEGDILPNETEDGPKFLRMEAFQEMIFDSLSERSVVLRELRDVNAASLPKETFSTWASSIVSLTADLLAADDEKLVKDLTVGFLSFPSLRVDVRTKTDGTMFLQENHVEPNCA